MHVIVVGAGEVGSYVARILVEETHDVSVIESDERLARDMDSSLDALVIHGSGMNKEVLVRAGVERADLFIAVTQVDEVNLIACMTAKKFGCPAKTIARVRDVDYLAGVSALSREDMGINLLVSPEWSVAERIVSLLKFKGTGEMKELVGGRLVLLELSLEDDSPLLNVPLANLSDVLPTDSLVAAIYGNAGVRIPDGLDMVKPKERIDIITTPESIQEMLILSGRAWHDVKHVLIIGCGTIGLHLATELESLGVYPTIIEIDPERAKSVSQKLARSMVLQGDGTDTNFLTEQLQETADAVVVLLEDDNEALLTGLFAKHLGARKVLVRAGDLAYAPIANAAGIDALLSPRRSLANCILQFVRRGHVEEAVMLGDNEGEVLEIEISEDLAGSKITESALCQLDFPEGALVGAVVRDEKAFIARGDTILKPGDRVLVVAKSEVLGAAEKMFK